jgi:hypothetical protein
MSVSQLGCADECDTDPNSDKVFKKALNKPLVIQGASSEWTVLSYYEHEGQLILDIEPKEEDEEDE